MISKLLKEKLFTSHDYRKFLRLVMHENSKNRGYKTKLSQYLNCQPAYLSQVTAGNVEFTPEQAERLCGFWELNNLESDYLFNLVLLGRSGTLTLKRRLEKKLDEIRELWKIETSTYGKPSVGEISRATLYYSHFLHSAIHLLLTIPHFQSEKVLAKHLQREEKEILLVIAELEAAGLVEKIETGWRALQVNIHATEKDFFAEVHHKNWRSQSLELRHSSREIAVRYTSIHSLSKEDFAKIKGLIEETIQNSRSVIEPSPEEMAACLLIDYFSV